jgi:hydroxylaminobenzene mutase
MKQHLKSPTYASRLLFLGVLLFLLGLVVALGIPQMANPRMGLSAHLEGTMNGMFLIILGLVWSKLVLNETWLRITFWLTIYGSFANFAAVTISAITGAGKLMPIAGGQEGTPAVEAIVSLLLITLSLAMIAVGVLVLVGLYRNIRSEALANAE